MFTPFAFVKQAAAGGGLGPLTTAFLAATGISDATIETALNDLETGLTTYSLGSKMVALYPMVGGTSDTTKYNFMDTSAFTISWNGTITFSSNGVVKTAANMQTAWGNTGVTPKDNLTLNDTHLAYYSRTQLTATGTDALTGILYPSDIGCGINSGGRFEMGICAGPNNSFWSRQYAENEQVKTDSQTTTTGLFVSSRTTISDLKTFRNSSQVGSTYSGAQSKNFTTSTGAIFVLAEANESSGMGVGTLRECAYASIGDGLSTTDVSNLYTIVQAFQTTLGRQV
jgi:hypothetical protein